MRNRYLTAAPLVAACLCVSFCLESWAAETSTLPTGFVVSQPGLIESGDCARTQVAQRNWQEPAGNCSRSAATAGKIKVALVLGGGGTRGAAHIGLLRVFEQYGIPIDMIVGCSMGAIVGGLYAAGVPLERIEQMCVDGELQNAYAPGPIPLQVLRGALAVIIRPFRPNVYAGLNSGERFEEFLDGEIPLESVFIERLRLPFSAVVTNMIDGQTHRLVQGKLAKAIRASSSLPPALRPVEFEDKLFIDGGVRANVPTYSARDLGADMVIAVSADEILQPEDPHRFRIAKNVANRVANITLDALDGPPLANADLAIRPDLHGIAILSRKSEDFVRAIDAGALAAHQALPQIRALLEKKLAAAQAAGSQVRRAE